MRRRSAWLFGPAALLCTGYAAAHHSFSAVFDSAQRVEITGTVTRVEWMNPHVWIYLNVAKEGSAPEEWAFEMGSPNRLTRYGWQRNSLAVGQTAKIVGSRSRDGSRKAAVDTVSLPSGEQLFGAQEPAQ
jgi:hypothetical protein